MQTADTLLLGLILLSGFNAARFERQFAEDQNNLRDLKKTIRDAENAGIELPNLSELKQQVDDIDTASHFTGNWLPSKYRQLISFTGIALVARLFSAELSVIAFVGLCCIGSTAALRFWLGLIASRRKRS